MKKIRLVLEFVLFGVLILLFVQKIANKKMISDLKYEISQKESQIKLQKDSIEALSERYLKLKKFEIDDKELLKLQAKGLANPITDLSNNLTNNSNIIPYKGVLGGTMKVYRCLILNQKWAFAFFEDGHIGGEMLLEYNVSDGGEINWRRIDAFIEN